MKKFVKRLLPFLLILSFAVFAAYSQSAEGKDPKRVEFENGEAIAVGQLNPGEETSFILHARGGQKIAIIIGLTRYFKFRMKCEDFEIESSFGDSDAVMRYRLNIPVDGDYLLFVERKSAKNSGLMKFRLYLKLTTADRSVSSKQGGAT